MADSTDSNKGSLVAIPFAATNVTTGASNQDLVLGSGLAASVFIPLKAGSIVGITAACGAITTGGIQIKAHRASTELTEDGAPAPTLNATNDTNGTYADVRVGAIRFAAGAPIGLSLTATTTALDPTNTLDVDAFLHIQYDA